MTDATGQTWEGEEADRKLEELGGIAYELGLALFKTDLDRPREEVEEDLADCAVIAIADLMEHWEELRAARGS